MHYNSSSNWSHKCLVRIVFLENLSFLKSIDQKTDLNSNFYYILLFSEGKIIGSWQRKTHSPIIMQSVKSTQVQKPVLQTAIAPQVPTTSPTTSGLPSYASSVNKFTSF